MNRAFVLGGTGQIGRAVVDRLLAEGWEVTSASRGTPGRGHSPGARPVSLDRTRAEEALADALDGTYDLLVDVVSMTADDGRQLAAVSGRVGSIVAVSSMSVYRDKQGRTLDEATDLASFPRMPVPVPTGWPTVEAGPASYSTRKVAMEAAVLEAAVPVTILRAGAVYGPFSPAPREWWVVKRLRDGRRWIPLAGRGAGVFHQVSTANLAEVVAKAAARPGTRILNGGDPEPLKVRDLVLTVAAHLGDAPGLLLMSPTGPDDGAEVEDTGVGQTPWSVPKDFIASLAEAEQELGPLNLVRYPEAVAPALDWLNGIDLGDWPAALPGLAAYGRPLFDYESEDRYLASLG